MGISHAELPRDANGLVPGAWRLVHKDPRFSGELGVVPFRDGCSTRPVVGRQLVTLAAIFGTSLFIEPWGDLPKGFLMPTGHSAKIPEAYIAKLKRAPWRDASAETSDTHEASAPVVNDTPDVAPQADTLPPPAEDPVADVVIPEAPVPADEPNLDAMDKPALLALVADKNLDIDKRLGEAKLRAAILDALTK